MSDVMEGYKKTEVGVIPEEWGVKNICDVAEVVGGGTPSTFTQKYWNGHINWFTPTEIGFNKYSYESLRKITEEGLKDSSAKLLPIGTILLTSRASIGDVSILKVPASTNQGFQSLIANENIDNEFLYYLISTLKNTLIKYASGSTFLEISPNKLKSIVVPIPPTRAEQTAIATTLKDADALITRLEKLIDKKRNIKQGAMQELLKPKEGGEVKKLGDFLDYEQPTKYLVEDTEYKDHNQTPVLTAGKSFILGYTNEEIGIFKNLPVIIFDDFTTASKFVDFPFKVKSSAMKMLKPKNEIVNLKFVFELMQTIKFDSIDHKRYWISEYQNIEVIVPKPEEQTRITNIFFDMDAEIEALEKKLEKYKMLKQGMMQELLTGKTRLIKENKA
jgi:type I restriction enzyme S subunit